MRPDAVALTWRQYRLERKLFWRNPSAAFFNFLLPLLFLAFFGAIFSSKQKDLDVIVPGIAGVAANAVTNTAIQVTIILVAGKVFFSVDGLKDPVELVVFVALGVVCFAS